MRKHAWMTAAALAAAVGGCGGSSGPEAAMTSVGAGLAAGEGGDACAALSGDARRDLLDAYSAGSCGAAASAVRGRLSDAEVSAAGKAAPRDVKKTEDVAFGTVRLPLEEADRRVEARKIDGKWQLDQLDVDAESEQLATANSQPADQGADARIKQQLSKNLASKFIESPLPTITAVEVQRGQATVTTDGQYAGDGLTVCSTALRNASSNGDLSSVPGLIGLVVLGQDRQPLQDCRNPA